ncbi:glycosyltransferase family 4 protein [Parasphingorhabdus pacifica]
MTTRRVRVATVITRLAGGAGTLALRGALGLDPAEYEVTLVSGCDGRLVDEARARGLEVIVEPALRAPIAPAHDLLALGRLARLFRRRSFDVVHTHCAKAGTTGRIAARNAGVPRIVHTFHGLPFHEFHGRARRHAYIAIERGLGRITDVALCVGTEVAAETIRKELVAPERVRTTGVAVDRDAVTRSSASRLRARRELGLDPDVPVVGAVGRLTYQKAPEDFISALRMLGRPNVVGVWVGDGEWAEQVRAMADEVPRPRIELVGERSDVVDLLPAFDVFVQPSRYEGLPLSVVEAMVCGIPVVATAVNAVGDVVQPGETGLLVPPRCPELLARSIARVFDDPAGADRRSVAARKRIDARYGLDALVRILETTYRAVPGDRS